MKLISKKNINDRAEAYMYCLKNKRLKVIGAFTDAILGFYETKLDLLTSIPQHLVEEIEKKEHSKELKDLIEKAWQESYERQPSLIPSEEV